MKDRRYKKRVRPKFRSKVGRTPAGPTNNVFCPTGQGGGVDATCSPGGRAGGRFTITARKDPEAIARRMGFESADQLVSCTGARPGWEARVMNWDADAVKVTLRDPTTGANAERKVWRRDGKLYVTNESFEVPEEHRGSGLGTKSFSEQVQACREAGVKSISCTAARWDQLKVIGYYVWPRMGYDADAPEDVRRKFPKAERMSDLMASQAGRDWWKKNGYDLEMEFDLTPGSRSLQIHEAYLRERAARPTGNAVLNARRMGMTAGRRFEEPYQSVEDDDALDLVWDGISLNVFCPTGKGGGVNPTCSPGGVGFKVIGADGVDLSKLAHSFGFGSPDDFGRAIGAQPGWTVTVGDVGGKTSIKVHETDAAGDFLLRCERFIGKYKDGSVYVKNYEFLVAEKHQGKGIGAKVFSDQVEACRALGIKEIRTTAGGDFHMKGMNGYYTWARMGYDTDLYEDDEPRMSGNLYSATQKFPEAKTLLDLMSSPGGADWWKKYGSEFDGVFDLSDGSKSMKVHRAYLAEKKKGTGTKKKRPTTNEYRAGDHPDLSPEDEAALDRAWAGITLNVFCPTGEGGGVDPTCGRGGVKKTATLRDGRTITFVPHDSARGRSSRYATVLVDVTKIDTAWRDTDPKFYIPPGGGGAEIPGRRDRFTEFLTKGRPVEASKVYVGKAGDVSFEDGRHRFSVLRDSGAKLVAVTVPRSSAERVKRMYGVGKTKSNPTTNTPSPPEVPAANGNPDQPRVPKGSSRGGEFASGKASAAVPPTLASLTESLQGRHGPDRVRAVEKVLRRYSLPSGPVQRHDMAAPEAMRHVTLDGVKIHYPNTPEGLRSAAVTVAGVTERPVPPALWRSAREVVHTSQAGRPVDSPGYDRMAAGATAAGGTITSYNGGGLARDTLLHEAGHLVAERVWGGFGPPVWAPYGVAQRTEPAVSQRAKADPAEDFADAVRMFASDNPVHTYELRSRTPKKYAALVQMFGDS